MEKHYLVNVDKKGRIVIPKEIRDKMNIRDKVKIIVKNNVIEIRPVLKNLSYKGIFKVNWNISKDVDEILEEALKERSRTWLKDILT
ncbi:MAG: AbrB/MazE/SpoVT family DNA-binding domain-containing protein [Thermoproteota archaeon]|nr:AbrB/MazE/SpoVT family DNA-binding domain-containing protein [Thermoproteota archaeon]